MKIYGHPMSTCTRKVLMTLAETKTSHEFVLVDFAKGEHKQPPHITRQPFGQVPALEDDGFAMYESRAMCRYINEKASGSLVPKDLRARATMEQWISIETSDFTPPAMKFIFQDVFKRPQEPSVLEHAGKQVDTALSVLEDQLGKHPYFAGDAFSLADVCFMPYFEYAMLTPLGPRIAEKTAISAWWKKVSERPTWRKVVGRD